MNRSSFAASYFRNIISLKWTQHKPYHKIAIPIMLFEFKIFLSKDLADTQAVNDSI